MSKRKILNQQIYHENYFASTYIGIENFLPPEMRPEQQKMSPEAIEYWKNFVPPPLPPEIEEYMAKINNATSE